MRVVMFPADMTGCGRYRMFAPALAAKREDGVEVLVSRIRREHTIRGVVVHVPATAAEADVIVFQRPCHRDVVATIPHLQAAGVAVVVELDDDLAALHPQHAMFSELHPRNKLVNWHHLRRACNLADLVTVTTPALAARYGAQKARVLPNCVPQSMLEIRADRDGRTVGWGGSTSTHIGDLKITHGGVAFAVTDADARFLAVGPPDGVQHDLGLAAAPDTTGGLPFAEYHPALAALDVGIAPLAQSAFNAAKSGLKLLEYAALGIACVGSPTPDYQRLHADGIGLIAKDRSRDWRRHVRALLTDTALRDELAAQGRQAVADHHIYERNGWRWAEAWAEAITRHRRRRAVAA